MTPARLSNILCWSLDWLALGALASTGENLAWVNVGVAVLGAWIALRGTPLGRPRLIAWSIAALVLGALGSAIVWVQSPLVVAANAAPLVQAMIWLLPEEGRKTPMRLCLGLVELVVAASLSTEFHLFLMIFAYVVVGAVASSCHFLASELRYRSPASRQDPLPRDFVLRIFGLSFGIFLSGLLIFPILPRLKWNGGLSVDTARVGYTEEVALTDRLKLSGSGDSGSPVLWFYSRSSGDDLSEEIFLGLIRGKALGIFDGIHWRATVPERQGLGAEAGGATGAPARTSREPGLTRLVVDAVRDPLGSGVLPVPYGTVSVVGSSPGIHQSPGGAGWVDPANAGERSSYTFEFVPFHIQDHGESQQDPPLREHLYVPPSLRTERMQRLAHQIFAGARAAKNKADRLMGFFRGAGFRASLGDSSPDSTDNLVELSPVARRLHRLERFLFLDKKGHCELFASSSAVLLRLAGVPARLVAGFRLTHGPVGGVLTVRSADAHAWVEYWDSERGWMPLDPTPRLLMPPGWLDSIRNSYDWVSGYWYRYILTFRWKPGDLSRAVIGRGTSPLLSRIRNGLRRGAEWGFRHQWALLFAAGLVALAIGVVYLLLLWKYPSILSIRHRVREGHPRLRRERRRLERWLAGRSSQARLRLERGSGPEDPVARALRKWRETYLRIRFGRGLRGAPARPAAPSASELRRLRARFRRMKRLAGPA